MVNSSRNKINIERAIGDYVIFWGGKKCNFGVFMYFIYFHYSSNNLVVSAYS